MFWVFLYLCVWCVWVGVCDFLAHFSPPRSKHTSPNPVPAGSVHARTCKTLFRPDGVESRSQFVELGAVTCSEYKIITFFLYLPIAGRLLCLPTACTTVCLPTAGRLCLSTTGRWSLSAAVHNRQTGPVHSRQRRRSLFELFYLRTGSN